MTFETILGRAGTGKSTIMRAHARMRNLAVLATTGVAAINQGGQTVHSWCRYNPSQDKFNISPNQFQAVNGIAIDEISMMNEDFFAGLLGQLDMLEQVTEHPFVVLVCGDFGQLPPVPSDFGPSQIGRMKRAAARLPWVFKADYWEKFAQNCTRLTAIHRQADPDFIDALTAARLGRGYEAATKLKKIGVKFAAGVAVDNDATVLYATNEKVNSYNEYKLKLLCRDGRSVVDFHASAGDAASNLIRICVGAPIMLLANNLDDGWANGTLAEVVEMPHSIMPTYAGPKSAQIKVHLLSGPAAGEEVMVGAISRRPMPIGKLDTEWGEYGFGNNWIWPFRLAWATTIHKVQGLTLDKVVVNCGEWFSNTPGAMYTALSRARNPEDLTIVGTVDKLAERIQADKEAMKWF